jgi:hypothetical protein
MIVTNLAIILTSKKRLHHNNDANASLLWYLPLKAYLLEPLSCLPDWPDGGSEIESRMRVSA